MKRLLGLSVIVSVVIFSLTSCNTNSEQSHLKILSWNLGSEPKSIDPTLSSTLVDGYVIRETFEGLVRENSGIIYPGIAKSWETSEDGKTITFHLRQSYWSDGTPLTAEDFIYGWKRGMDPNTSSESSWIWEYTNIEGAYECITQTGSLDEVGLWAPDDYTLVVQLTKPTNYLISLFSSSQFMPIKESALSNISDDNWAIDSEQAISNGPFILEEYQLGAHITLKKNPYFWDKDSVKLDGMNLYFTTEESTAYQAYVNGDLLAIPNVPTDKVSIFEAESDDFHSFPILGTYYFSFNLNTEIWQDIRVRQAINLAINREVITQTIGSSNIPATGFVPNGFLDTQGNDFNNTIASSASITTPNVAEAKRLLSEVGYPDGKGFPSFEILYNTNESNLRIAEMIQEMLLTNLNIKTTLSQQEWTVYLNTRSIGNYEFSKGSWYTDFLDPIGMLSIFTTDNPKNVSNYSNLEFDQLIYKAHETTGMEHFDLLHDAHEILMNDLPIVPIYHYADSWLINENVGGWNRSSMGIIDFSRADITYNDTK